MKLYPYNMEPFNCNSLLTPQTMSKHHFNSFEKLKYENIMNILSNSLCIPSTPQIMFFVEQLAFPSHPLKKKRNMVLS